MADLLDSYIRVTEIATGVAHEYRLIERIDIEKRPIRRKDDFRAGSQQLEMWFNGCTLSPEFFGLLSRIAELQHLKLTPELRQAASERFHQRFAPLFITGGDA